VNINKLIVEDGCSKNIGSRAHYLQLTMQSQSDRQVQHYGTGTNYLDIDYCADFYAYNAGSGSSSSGTYGLNVQGEEMTQFHAMPSSSSARIGLAPLYDEDLHVDQIIQTNGTLKVGPNVEETDGSSAITSLTVTGGTCYYEGATGVTTMKNEGDGGDLHYEGGAVTTLNAWAGTTYYKGTGTITTANVGSGSVLDFSENQESRTVTNANAYASSSIRDPHGTATWTNGIVTKGCNAINVTLETKSDGTLTPS